MVSTTADPDALRRVLLAGDVVGAWPGFVEQTAERGPTTTWRTRRVASRSFPPGGTWDVEHHLLRDDVERPEIRLDCSSGRSAVSVTVATWALAPHVRVIRVGVRHGSAGRLRYAPRKLRRTSQDFGKALAVRAGGEVLERVGIETVQRLGILDSPQDDAGGEPLVDPLDPDASDGGSDGGSDGWR